ncbi:lactose-binding lectin l-2-like isoform X1 [Cheilinus undulatus]|uniref:lactose-binding lectin l-2-like isoform X1 n=1 Tax=Cheilinus undulatus TaxID=241271 RepID=UPI001BD238E5|nr:lactose-binding lectin l-2-like isoform X1 [Cheilinus undulatus]
MLLLLFLFSLALGAAPLSEEPDFKLQRGGCRPFWYSFNGRCYKYVSTPVTWATAELHCVSQRANLVSIHSLAEQHFVKSLIRNFDPSERPTWIGLSDIHREGRWMWSDGLEVNFMSWLPGQPDNDRRKEHCAHMNWGSLKRWNDMSCSKSYSFVCATRICY